MFCPLIVAAAISHEGVKVFVGNRDPEFIKRLHCQKEDCGFFNIGAQACGQSLSPLSRDDLDESLSEALDSMIEANRMD